MKSADVLSDGGGGRRAICQPAQALAKECGKISPFDPKGVIRAPPGPPRRISPKSCSFTGKLGRGWGASGIYFEELNKGDHDPHGLYVIKCGPYYKIGISHSPLRRLEGLRGASPFSVSLVMVRTMVKFYARQYERSVHQKLAAHHHRGEWYFTDLATIKVAIDATRPEALRWIRERADLMRDDFPRPPMASVTSPRSRPLLENEK